MLYQLTQLTKVAPIMWLVFLAGSLFVPVLSLLSCHRAVTASLELATPGLLLFRALVDVG